MPKNLFKEANKYLVGGVNSPVRAFGAVGGEPIFIKQGQGSRVRGQEGKEYLDYVMSWGALILGHADKRVVAATKKAIEQGSSFGAPTKAETELAKLICEAIPSIEKVRFTSSGTEAVMGALKLAKGITGKNKIIKFKQCYHGWSEQDYLEAEYNNLDSAKALLSKEVAAVIVEPVVGNAGVIPPEPGFLQGLRCLCDQHGVLLVFDEVITGFRLAYGGAEDYFGVKPDLTCLGKIIGAGFPVGAFGGRADLMANLAPEGKVYQAGTLSGNPVAMAAGLSTLKILKNKKVYKDLEIKTKYLCEGSKLEFNRAGSMFSFRFESQEAYAKFFWQMLAQGIYFAPSSLEANFISCAHGWSEIKETIRKILGR
ncbi:aspartate aminotransferase family protein [Candidatus Saganbacteria bacterium CG08_land_8_20_14_0_20_45_16]|uniref:Glutamate-1-semialdehyde 2,1-aminomutase n=1 Tax=Candidatus Saganbacteria bacterium CG08_land_8_20_14_0_20_45_16 TaxID=2014293 RepID=A0A2H0XU24_UNCSA|nr:MAG: aspartate aminotransferase family protein [Candidatus Saganbacteria bacterium CG08_land_8_20_14_0_20_45_16]